MEKRVKRQIKQSARKLFSDFDYGDDGVAVIKEKSKRQKVRKLSDDCENECFKSDEDFKSQMASPSCNNKRQRISKRFSYDCNSVDVDHMPVPRKLRSAVKKRNLESASPPLSYSDKTNKTISVVDTSTNGGSTKKSKLDMKQGFSFVNPGLVVSASITRDEEEVAETLYALARMFSTVESIDIGKLDGPDDNPDSMCPSETAEASINPSCGVKGLSMERVVNTEMLVKPCDKVNIYAESDSALIVNMQNSGCQEKDPICNTVNVGGSTQQKLETGFKQPKLQEALSLDQKPKLELASHIESLQEQQHSIKEKNGLGLWPGLYPSHGAETYVPLLQQSSATKYPAWMQTTTSAIWPNSSQNGFTKEKVFRAAVERKSRKRCTGHVYISHLIESLRTVERKGMRPVQLNHWILEEGLKHEPFTVVSNLNAVKKENSGLISTAEKNSNPTTNNVQSYASSKQNYDFLSLSSGGGGMKSHNNTSKYGMESMSQIPIPYFHSLAQNQTTMTPFSLPQSRYSASTSTHPDRLSQTAAQQVSLKHHMNQFSDSSRTKIPFLKKQQQVQLQQHQHQQHFLQQKRPEMNSQLPFPNWKNGTSLVPYVQTIPKYLPQQQQQVRASLMAAPTRLIRQHHGGNNFRSGNITPSQLLCNEYL